MYLNVAAPEIVQLASSFLSPAVTLRSIAGTGVFVGVGVAVGVLVGVAVFMGVGVRVGVAVVVGVGVAVPGLITTTLEMMKSMPLFVIHTLTWYSTPFVSATD